MLRKKKNIQKVDVSFQFLTYFVTLLVCKGGPWLEATRAEKFGNAWRVVNSSKCSSSTDQRTTLHQEQYSLHWNTCMSALWCQTRCHMWGQHWAVISSSCEARRVGGAIVTTQNILTGRSSKGFSRLTLRGSPLWSSGAAYLRAAHDSIICRRFTSRRNVQRASDDKGRLASAEFSRIKGGKQ